MGEDEKSARMRLMQNCNWYSSGHAERAERHGFFCREPRLGRCPGVRLPLNARRGLGASPPDHGQALLTPGVQEAYIEGAAGADL